MKENSEVYYFETIDFKVFYYFFIKKFFILNVSSSKFFYIDCSVFTDRIIIPLLKFVSFNIKKLTFLMIDINDMIEPQLLKLLVKNILISGAKIRSYLARSKKSHKINNILIMNKVEKIC